MLTLAQPPLPLTNSIALGLLVLCVSCGGNSLTSTDNENARPSRDVEGESTALPPDSDDGGDQAPATTGCGCTGSPALQPLLCGDERATVVPSSDGVHTSQRGDVALLSRCYSSDGRLPADSCLVWRWTAADGAELLGENARAIGIANDGTALIASIRAAPVAETLLWVRPDGTRDVVSLSSGTARLSALGTYVVGFAPTAAATSSPAPSESPAPPSRAPLARWSASDGYEILAQLPGDLADARVAATSPDASVVVGRADDWSTGDDVEVPIYWTAATGLRQLAGAPLGARGATVLLTSRDGSALAGVSREGDFGEVFHWTQAAGFRRVTAVSILGGVYAGQRMSDDGEVLAGTGWQEAPGQHRVYRWTAGDFSWIGPETAASLVVDMSADGATVVGRISDSGEGFIWSEGQLTMLADLLVTSGVDGTGWQLQEPVSLSDDGSTLFGRGLCNGEPVLYRWQLPR